MGYPTLAQRSTARIVTDVFRGYNHRLRIADGEFYDTKNLTTEHYPLLATRKKRGVYQTMTAPGGLIEKDALCYVESGTLYVNGSATGLTNLSAGEKQLVGMGAYILIFPDKMYYNTESPTDCGFMEATFTYTESAVTYTPCAADGTAYTISDTGGTEPESPENGDIWYDTEGNRLEQYSSALGTWESIETVYTKVTFTGSQGSIPSLFSEGDGVTITGLESELNGSKVIFALGGISQSVNDYIVVIGLVSTPSTASATVTIKRELPALDYVVECQNRLWGCHYGYTGGETVNELYCSALGDFKNWRVYQGLSTDSWAASVGSDGQWTGAANYQGHPTFFKENRIHVITVSASGAHRVDEISTNGVQKGSAKSAVVVGETLYYKSASGVFAWQGGFPVSVSEALGEERYTDAVGGAVGSRYYLSMKDSANHWHLFVYDIARGLWMREDALHAVDFCRVGAELWCLDADKHLIALLGSAGTAESTLPWALETGVLTYESPDKKYLSRYDIRLSMDSDTEAQLFMEYDSSGLWESSGSIRLSGTGTVTVPVRPRRCDHLRMRIEGTGSARIFSVARILEVGSDG